MTTAAIIAIRRTPCAAPPAAAASASNCNGGRSSGCALVELLTHHTRVDAQRFYERLGFVRSRVGMVIRF